MDRIVVFFSEKVFKILQISLIVHDRIRPTADILSMRLEECYLFLEFRRMPEIIVILDSNIVSLGFFEEKVESVIGSEIFPTTKKYDGFIVS
jgi:hypothetical protein